MALDVFPTNNLPPESVPWGRDIDNKAKSLAYQLDSLGDSSGSNNRATAATAGIVSRTVDQISAQFSELSFRRVEYVTHPGFTASVTTANFANVSFSGDGTVAIPPSGDGEVRVAVVLCSMQGYSSNTDAGSATVSSVLSGGGLQGSLAFGPFPVPAMSNIPPGWNERGFAQSNAQTAGSPLSLSFSGTIFGNGVFTLQLGVSNIELAIIYGQRV